MLLNTVDISSSALRAVNKTLRAMCNIRLQAMPDIKKSDIFGLRIMTPSDTFTSLITLQQRGEEGLLEGGIVVYISHYNIEPLFGFLGVTNHSDVSEIRDVCTEFCNVLAGAFKTEISALGQELIEFLSPQNYYGVIDEEISTHVSYKYTLSFSHAGKGILLVDIFIEE